MTVVEEKGTPASRLGFAPIAPWRVETDLGGGRSRVYKGAPGIFTPIPPRPHTD